MGLTNNSCQSALTFGAANRERYCFPNRKTFSCLPITSLTLNVIKMVKIDY